MNKHVYSALNYGHSAMGHGRCDYEGVYGISSNISYYGFHCHDFYEFYIHLQGGKHYGIDNEHYMLEPNQLIVVPPFHMHGLMTEEPLIYYERAYLYISGDLLRMLGMQRIDLLSLLTEYTRNQRYLFSLTDEQAKTCARLIQEIQDSKASTPWDRFADYSRIMPLLKIVLEVLQSSPSDVQQNACYEPVMQKILIYINEHFTEPLTLRDIFLRFGVSMSSLSHDFFRYIHHSVYDYVLYRRVMYAKKLMFDNTSISEICYVCGFQTYSSFSRAFNKICGISPSEYRKQLAESTEK